MADDTLISFGGSVKSLGDGRVGGYLVVFTGANDPDLTGEFFTRDTDFWFDPDEQPVVKRVIYNHGFDKVLGLRKIGKATLRVDDAGVWAEAQLDLRDEYERKIESLAKAEKLGWSSGSAPHLVTYERVGGVKRIVSWPITEATLTPTPAEPRARIMAMKSLKVMSEAETDQPDAETIKPGMHVRHKDGCGAVKEIFDTGEHETPAGKCLATNGAPMAHVDMHDDGHKCTGKVKCYPVKDLEMVPDSEPDNDEDDAPSKALTIHRGGSVPESFLDHSRVVVSAVGEFVERAEDRLDARVKAGRELSAANRTEIDDVCTSLETGVGRLRAILDRTAPPAVETPGPEYRKAVDPTALLRLQAELLGIDQFLSDHAPR